MKKHKLLFLSGVAVVFTILGMFPSTKVSAIKASAEPGSPLNNEEIVLRLKANPGESFEKEISLKDINFKLTSNVGKVEEVSKLNLFKDSDTQVFGSDTYQYPKTNLNLNYSFSNLTVAKSLSTNTKYLWQAYNVKIGKLNPKTKYKVKVGLTLKKHAIDEKQVFRNTIDLRTDKNGKLIIPLYNSMSFAAANNTTNYEDNLKPSTITITRHDLKLPTSLKILVGSMLLTFIVCMIVVTWPLIRKLLRKVRHE